MKMAKDQVSTEINSNLHVYLSQICHSETF